jgi:hypothetical protein
MDMHAALVAAKDALEKAATESFVELTGLELKSLGLPKKPVPGVRIVNDCLVAEVDDDVDGKHEHRQVVFSYKDTDWGVEYLAPPGNSKRKIEPWKDDAEYVVSQFKVTISPIDTDDLKAKTHAKPPKNSAARTRRRPKTKSTVSAGLEAAA